MPQTTKKLGAQPKTESRNIKIKKLKKNMKEMQFSLVSFYFYLKTRFKEQKAFLHISTVPLLFLLFCLMFVFLLNFC